MFLFTFILLFLVKHKIATSKLDCSAHSFLLNTLLYFRLII